MSKVLLVSRCAWTLYNFRLGQMRTLQNEGANVICGGAGGDGYEERIAAEGIRFEALPIDRRAVNPVSDIRLVWSLFRWYRRERPEVVHHFTIKPVIYGSIAARLAGVPRVVNTVTGLGYVFSEGSAGWLRKLVEFQYGFALRFAHHTFFQNDEDRRLFIERKLVAEARSTVLPGSGVDTEHFAPTNGRESDANSNAITFLMVARLLRDKGVYEFVEAARKLRSTYPNARFQLLGQRDERNPRVVPKEDLDKWQSEDLVNWLGETSDVRGAMGRASVVVLPSYYREGTPRSLLEAASMGKPLITTDSVGCREAVTPEITGLLVPPRDSDALARAMERLITDSEARIRMGSAGRDKMIREFEEKRVIARVLASYNSA